MEINDLRLEDLHWIAGFLEGEGTFGRCGGTIIVAASQVNKEPVDKLYNLLGGSVLYLERINQNPKWNNCYRWTIYGENAELLMKVIFPIMSIKIKNKISEILSWYASRPGRNFAKSGRKTCRKGLHLWTDKNTFINYRGIKTCRLCNNLAQERYRIKKRALKQVSLTIGGSYGYIQRS